MPPTKRTPTKAPANKLVADDRKSALGETVTINIALPRELHRQLKIGALMEDILMQDAVIDAIAEWVAKR